VPKSNQNGFKSLFYATTEFDLSRSDSEDDEEENYSLNSIKNNKQSLADKVLSFSNRLYSPNNTSSTTVNSNLNNQTSVQ
jgi:hypothetical protein